MNQQVKHRIKSSICPRQKWVQDKLASNCFRCDKRFSPLFLRKHHCRICGQIFCAACSEYFLPGLWLETGEKQLRMCELCHKKISRYINEHEAKDNGSFVSKESEEKEKEGVVGVGGGSNNRSQHLRDLIAQDEEETLESAQLRAIVEEKISMLVQITLKQNKIPFDYYQYLVKLILRVVKDVPPNAMTTGNMGICKHIKIIKTRHQNLSKSHYFIGTLVPLNVYSKKIASRYNCVRVMLVYGGMELDDIMGSKSSFESLLENRKKELNNLIYLLVVVLSVNVVFVEKNVEKEVLDVLHENSIAVISKVSMSTLARLRISLKIKKIVESVSRLKGHAIEEIIGVSKSITLERFGAFPDDEKHYLAVEGDSATQGLTIVMSGPNQPMLRRIKKQLRPLLVLSRHLYLKLSYIMMDQKLMSSKKVQLRKSTYPTLVFKSFNDKHSNLAYYLKQNYLNYKRIVFVETQYSLYPQIPKEDYMHLNRGKKRFQKKWEHFTDICNNGQGYRNENRRFYSEDDWPLGEYLLKKLLNIERRCERCQQPGYKHVEMYYGANLYVKVEVEARILEERASQRVELEENDIENVFEELAKRKEKHKIEHYLECEDCQLQLSSRFAVQSQHLEMSLLAFLGNIFMATNHSMLKPIIQEQSYACNHERMCRVFQLGGTFLKVYTGFLIVAPKYQISPEKTLRFIEEKNLKYTREVCLSQRSNIDKIITYLQDQLKSFSDIIKSSDFEAMIKNPKASILKAKTSFIRNSMLTQTQCIEILIPEILEEVSRVEISAGELLDYKKLRNHCEAEFRYKICVGVLSRILNVIVAMKKFASKRELNQKYVMEEEAGLIENFNMEELIGKEERDNRVRVGSQYTENTDKVTVVDEGEEEIAKYQNWISTQEGEPINRKYRKSSHSFAPKKEVKATQAEIETIFKMSSWPYKYQNSICEHITSNPYVSQSLIATALNSASHEQCLRTPGSSMNYIDNLRIKLVQAQNMELPSQFQDLKKISLLVEVQQRMMGITSHKKTPYAEINILYPQMFQKIRNESDLDINLYIQTIAGVESWMNTGGKSGSPFMRAHNDLVIVKRINQKEFHCLKKILPSYLRHIQEGSLLTPIFGSYEVVKGPKSEYYIVMENLFFGMNNWQIYDFKGSRIKRYSKPPVIPLDINYLLDRNSEPLMTAHNILGDLPRTLQFLANNNIIDYSLVLVVNIDDVTAETLDGCSIKIGMIDYLRSYGGLEKIETVIKGLKGNETTVIGAQPYKDRMFASVSKYFCSLPH